MNTKINYQVSESAGVVSDATEEIQQLTRLISTLLGGWEMFAELLVCLPDKFFRYSEPRKLEAWKDILHELNRGVRDPEFLAFSAHNQEEK